MIAGLMVLAALAIGLLAGSCGWDRPVLAAKQGTAADDLPAPGGGAPLTATPILIDTRSPQEYAGGHLAGALLMPYDAIGGMIEARVPDKNTPIQLYCRSGGRSEVARKTLVSLNYTSVENLGGMRSAAGALKKEVVK